MKSNLLTAPVNSKNILRLVVVIAATAALAYSGKVIFDKLTGRPKSPSAVRREIASFLKEKSGTGNFAMNVKEGLAELANIEKQVTALQEEIASLPTTITNLATQIRTNRQELNNASQALRKAKTEAGINAAPTTTNRNARVTNAAPVFNLAAASQTNEQFKAIYDKEQALNAKQTQLNDWQKELTSLNNRLRDRQRALNTVEKELRALQAGSADLTLARQCQKQLQDAPSWQVIFKTLGQELWLVDSMLSSTNIEMRQSGLRLADQARVDAYSTAENSWLACRIIEGYIWPNVDLTDARITNGVSLDQLLNNAGNTFQNSEETNCIIRNLELLIAEGKNPARVDNNRMKLAQLLEKLGKYDGALTHLRAVQTTNYSANATKMIASIEKTIKDQKNKKK
jgi:hypothetical protein